MRVSEWIFAAACLTWWGVTALKQMRVPMGPLLHHDVFSLLPSYRFFAPRPQFADYFLEFRIRTTSGEPGPWEAVVLHQPRTWLSVAFAPARLQALALDGLIENILERTKAGLEVGPSHHAYFRILALVGTLAPRQVELQFQVLTGMPGDSAASRRLLLTSSWHRPGQGSL